MTLAALAWRNLWRRPQRTALSLASIAFTSALLVFALSYQLAVYDLMKESSLRIFDGFAQLQPLGYADDPAIDHALDNPVRLESEALALPGIRTAAARVAGFAILTHGERSYGAAVAGVDPQAEPRVSSFARTIRAGRYLESGDTDAAVIGAALARNLGLGVGERVTLFGLARDGSIAADALQVVGVYETGVPELDRSLLEMPIARAQETFAMEERVNVIALGGPSLEAVDRELPRLDALARREGVEALGWTRLEPAMYAALALKYATSVLFYLTLIVVVAFIILNTLLMSVLERTREFAVLLALGLRPRAIGLLVWTELLALSLLGCAIGIAAGAAATLWLEQRGVAIPGLESLLAQFGLPPRLYPSLSWLSATAGPAAIVAAIVVGGLVPWLRVSRLTAASALRTSA